jgi:hypothetical protein
MMKKKKKKNSLILKKSRGTNPELKEKGVRRDDRKKLRKKGNMMKYFFSPTYLKEA